SDQTLLLAADGELNPSEAAQVATHLAACWTCRTRRQEIEASVGEFMRDYRGALDPSLPSAAGPRALLKLRLEQLAGTEQRSWFSHFHASPLKLAWALAAVFCGLSIAAYFVSASGLIPSSQSATVTVPDRSLTPGAAILASRD